MNRFTKNLFHSMTFTALAAAVASACGEGVTCSDTLSCRENPDGIGGERPDEPLESEGGQGGAHDAETSGCADGSFDCNGSESDGCESLAAEITTPFAPASLRPLRNAFTGSLHGRARGPVLRPTLEWSASESSCGALTYRLQMDDSCLPGGLDDCAFDSPEIDATTPDATFTPEEDLPVQETVPVGAFYAWRVQACDRAENCSPWSAPAPLQVGRTLQDLNGDGYADALVQNNLGLEIFLGGENFNGVSDHRFAIQGSNPRFVGDLNGDGFADLGIMTSAFELCATSGFVARILYGAADLDSSEAQTLCRTAGSPSVMLGARDVGDLTGDGFDDLAVSWDYSADQNTVLLFEGGDQVVAEPLTEPPTLNRSYYLASSSQIVVGRNDFNGDGYADLVAAGYATLDPIEIFVLLGGTKISPQFDHTLRPEDCRTAKWIEATGDLNDDGKDDFAFVCGTSAGSRLGILHGGAAELPALSEVWDTSLPLENTTPFLDFDGDGSKEFLIGVTGESPVIWQMNPDEALSPPRYTRFTDSARLDVADHNGDGRLDVVFGSDTSAARAGASTSFNAVPANFLVPTDVTNNYSIGF